MNNLSVITGNVLSLLAMASDSFSSTQKTAKRVLLVQCFSQLLYCACGIVLKGYSGAVQNAVSILRNLAAIKNIKSKSVEWFLVILGVVLGICFNNRGLMGYLPVIANLQYTLAVFRFKDNERALKISFMISVFMFAVFNLALYNFVGVVTNMIVFATTAVYLIKNRPAKTN